MAKDPRFLVIRPLGGGLPGSKWRNILGAVVKYPFFPLEEYEPKQALDTHNEFPLIETLHPHFLQHNRSIISSAQKHNAETVGQLRWSRNAGDKIMWQGKMLETKRLKHENWYWENLVSKEDQALRKVAKWASMREENGKSTHFVCFVVGVLLGEDLTVARTDTEAEEHWLQGDAPLGKTMEVITSTYRTSAETEGFGGQSMKGAGLIGKGTHFKTSVHGQQVLALELRRIKVGRGELKETNTTSAGVALGHEVSPGSLSPRDLLFDEVSEDDWRELLDE